MIRASQDLVHSFFPTLFLSFELSILARVSVACTATIMPVIHIVLVKVKATVLANGFDELKQKCQTLKDLPIAQQKVKELSWGPPAYPGRNEGYNWGE